MTWWWHEVKKNNNNKHHIMKMHISNTHSEFKSDNVCHNVEALWSLSYDHYYCWQNLQRWRRRLKCKYKANYENEYFPNNWHTSDAFDVSASYVQSYFAYFVTEVNRLTKESINGVNETLILKPTGVINHFHFEYVCLANENMNAMHRHVHVSHSKQTNTTHV